MVEEQKQDKKYQIITRTGESIYLPMDICKKFIAGDQNITQQEYTFFFAMCKSNKLNPFNKEAYLIKYGTAPATMVIDYKILQQIAENNPNYLGMKHGVVVSTKEGKIIERVGAIKLSDEELIGGWCEVKRRDKTETTKVVAMFEEFAAKKGDGTLNSNWKGKPCFMIEKVAKAQALREAFPNALGTNVYTPEEMDRTVEEHNEETPKDARETHKAKNAIEVDDNGEIKDSDSKNEAKK